MSLTPKQKDAMAKQLGFNTYEEWRLFNEQQEKKTNPNTVKKPRNVLQNAAPPKAKKKPGHVLDYVARRYQEVTGK